MPNGYFILNVILNRTTTTKRTTKYNSEKKNKEVHIFVEEKSHICWFDIFSENKMLNTSYGIICGILLTLKYDCYGTFNFISKQFRYIFIVELYKRNSIIFVYLSRRNNVYIYIIKVIINFQVNTFILLYSVIRKWCCTSL